MEPRVFLQKLFEAAVAAAQPALCLPPHLPPKPKGRAVVVGAGKASAEMARVVEANWDGPLSGLVVTRYGHSVPCQKIEIVEAAHPVPDPAGVNAARRILRKVRGLTADDVVICLISGGGSALLSLPAAGLTLDDKQAVNRELLRCGATIAEINCIRKHLSAIKGGRLAVAAAPAPVVTLAISDVPGDDPAIIASGPTVAAPTTYADAREMLARYGAVVPDGIANYLQAEADETPKPGDLRLEQCQTILIARPQVSLEAAAEVVRQAGIIPVILGDAIEGEAREVGKVHAAVAQQIARHGQPVTVPAVLLSGGETTVTMLGTGRGGRNGEFALSLAVALDGAAGIHAIACDTDGIDGSEDNAGAMVTPDTLTRAVAVGLNARNSLANNDAYGFFEPLGDLVESGPTFTNVNDFRAILVN